MDGGRPGVLRILPWALKESNTTEHLKQTELLRGDHYYFSCVTGEKTESQRVK